MHKGPQLQQHQLLKDLPFPIEFLGTFVENQFTTYAWAYFWLYSISLIYLSSCEAVLNKIWQKHYNPLWSGRLFASLRNKESSI